MHFYMHSNLHKKNLFLQKVSVTVGELYQALLQLDGESGMVQVGLFLIRVDVV
jgi:hypothetical protein